MEFTKEIERQLKAPFPPEHIKSRPMGGKKLHYIDARNVMDRLDEVVGMGEWRDQYRTRFSCEPPADGKIVTAAVTYDCPGGRDFLLRGERRGGMFIAHELTQNRTKIN